MLPPPAGYAPPNTQLPHDLIVRFWEDVYETLQVVHGMTASDSLASILRCRAETDREVGDMRYHIDPSDLAATIAAGWITMVRNTPITPARGSSQPVSPPHPATTTP